MEGFARGRGREHHSFEVTFGDRSEFELRNFNLLSVHGRPRRRDGSKSPQFPRSMDPTEIRLPFIHTGNFRVHPNLGPVVFFSSERPPACPPAVRIGNAIAKRADRESIGFFDRGNDPRDVICRDGNRQIAVRLIEKHGQQLK